MFIERKADQGDHSHHHLGRYISHFFGNLYEEVAWLLASSYVTQRDIHKSRNKTEHDGFSDREHMERRRHYLINCAPALVKT